MLSSIYIKATLTLIAYSLISKSVFGLAVIQDGFLNSLLAPTFFGMLASCIFLYLFSHDDFLRFVKVIEMREEKKEKKWLKKFKHSGKILTTVAIGTLAGPMFSAFTARILLQNYPYKYLLVVAISIPSTIFSVGVTKGIIAFF